LLGSRHDLQSLKLLLGWWFVVRHLVFILGISVGQHPLGVRRLATLLLNTLGVLHAVAQGTLLPRQSRTGVALF